jgi:tRNA 2-thiouridine synthesizing protein D
MDIAILINEGPFTHQASDSAYRFAVAAIAKGHKLGRVFFYNDGVYNANKLSEPQTDDRNLVSLWAELGKKNGIDLVVCIAAALRRGIKEDVLQDGFRISGLGQLVEAGIENDRLVVFGD